MVSRLQALAPDVWRVLRNRAALRARVRTRDERPDGRRYLKFVNKTSSDGGPSVAEVLVYDEIGLCGVEAPAFVQELQGITADTIHVRINSPGGDVFDSIAIYNALMDHPARVEVTVDSLAASGASVIAMAGEKITMNRGSQMMIHDAYTASLGNAADMREIADLLDRFSDAIAGVYADRGGGAAGDWRDLMRAETWYTGPEAVDAKLAHAAVDAPVKAPDDEPVPVYNLVNSMFFFAGRAAAPAPRPVGRVSAAPAKPVEPVAAPPVMPATAPAGTAPVAPLAKALPVHHTATENSAWDGPAAVKAMPNDDTVLRYCHAWQDSQAAATPHREGDDDADDQKSNYKFPHHRTKGGPANLAACRNGLARLDGADIPDGDRAGVQRHLQAHLDDAHDSDDGGGHDHGDGDSGMSNHADTRDGDEPFVIDPKVLRKAVKTALRAEEALR